MKSGNYELVWPNKICQKTFLKLGDPNPSRVRDLPITLSTVYALPHAKNEPSNFLLIDHSRVIVFYCLILVVMLLDSLHVTT